MDQGPLEQEVLCIILDCGTVPFSPSSLVRHPQLLLLNSYLNSYHGTLLAVRQ